jgi:hypothetical protein
LTIGKTTFFARLESKFELKLFKVSCWKRKNRILGPVEAFFELHPPQADGAISHACRQAGKRKMGLKDVFAAQ